MSGMSEFGYTKFSRDGRDIGWCRFLHPDQDEQIAQSLEKGMTLLISRSDYAPLPLRREESKMFEDMTYAACRARYTAYRVRVIAAINSGGISASMSGIDDCPLSWDEMPPETFDPLLKSFLTWNGVRSVKTDWEAMLRAFHPRAGEWA